MKIVYISDNRNRENWGCRATSKALADLISTNNEIIYTIFGDLVSNHIPIFGKKIPSNRFLKLFLKLMSKLSEKINIYLPKISDYISEDLQKSQERFEKLSVKHPLYREMKRNLLECDAIVINGEGDAIFTTPSRRKLLFLLMIMRIAQNANKKTFYVNAMFSDCPKSGRNLNILSQAIDVLSQCTLVAARDLDSFNYLNQFEHNIKFQHVPDALFSWTKYENYICNVLKYPLALPSFPEYDEYWNNFDFSKPYICVSGSSSAAWTQMEAQEGYTKLIQALKTLDYKLFIVPTCSGDRFLYNVAEQTGIPIVPVNTNIIGGMSILANAAVFVSGRWHPSILASLGGTPCVIFGSNSSKTKSFLNVMDYEQKREYSAIPTEDEMPFILNDICNYVQQGDTLRSKIKNKAQELSELTNFYKNI